MNAIPLTRCFNGRVNGRQYQLRIQPKIIRPKAEEMTGATEAELIVFDAFGIVHDSFERGFHYQYGTDYIKKAMRQTAIDREEIPGLTGPGS